MCAGLKKRLFKLAKERECGDIGAWIKSIVNHLYWVAASTPEADGDLMLQKWKSLTNHLHDKHEHGNAKFPVCLHPELVGEERKKKWLKGGKLTFLCVHTNEQILKIKLKDIN